MSYVVAGYALAFATLASYSGWVLHRRRRLERIFAAARRDGAAGR